MPRKRVIYRCLLISPSDVEAERDAVESAVTRWNAHIGEGLEARVEVVRWESHSTPDLSSAPQDVINRQLVDDCDIGIALFWSRLGSPTVGHASGSVEEIERLLSRQCRVMVYFCQRDIPQERLKDDQFLRLQELRRQYQQRGLLSSFLSGEQLAGLVNLHLTSLVNELLITDQAAGQPVPSTGTVTAPKPDIQVKVAAAFAAQGQVTSSVIGVSVENHSPVDFFMSSIKFLREDLSAVFVGVDCLTGQHLMPRKIEPGNSFAFHIDPDLIERETGSSDLLSAIVTDKIGRTFHSASGAMRVALSEWAANMKAVRSSSYRRK
jgi:hypothetical protein